MGFENGGQPVVPSSMRQNPLTVPEMSRGLVYTPFLASAWDGIAEGFPYLPGNAIR